MDATSYIIFRATSATGSYSQIATVKETSYTNTGLTPSRTYYYKVQVTNSEGTSAYSSVHSVTTQVAPSIPLAPAMITASAGSSSSVNLEVGSNLGKFGPSNWGK